jgi:hypothetical protein
MISSSPAIVSFVFSFSSKLTGKFTSLEEPTDDFDHAADAVFPADRPDLVRSERRIIPREPT